VAACAGDTELRAHVFTLLAAHDRAGDFLADATVGAAQLKPAQAVPSEAPGTAVGPYRVVHLIGEGGFGSVYLAEQEQPVRRQVVIHRDLKPNNVLVSLQDGAPVPKVIDFGIAKATAAPLTDKTLLTELRQMVGTPAYMSPEQAEMNGLDVDTRSDIYSLGVLLYELLTGTT